MSDSQTILVAILGPIFELSQPSPRGRGQGEGDIRLVAD